MRAERLARAVRDPFLSSVTVSAALVIAGFVSIGLAWRGAARLASVAGQLPFILSGGLAGLGLIGCGLALVDVQLRRRAEAADRADFDRVLAAGADLLATIEHRSAGRK